MSHRNASQDGRSDVGRANMRSGREPISARAGRYFGGCVISIAQTAAGRMYMEARKFPASS
jgi:hypothetical protein